VGVARPVTGPRHGARPDGPDRPGRTEPVVVEPGPARSADRVRSWVPALSGTVVAGLVVLALGLLLVWVVVGATGSPGPGPLMLAGHAVGAVLAVLLHRTARGRTDSRGRADAIGLAAALGPIGVLVLLGLIFWWS